jgi:hypothetical protein
LPRGTCNYAPSVACITSEQLEVQESWLPQKIGLEKTKIQKLVAVLRESLQQHQQAGACMHESVFGRCVHRNEHRSTREGTPHKHIKQEVSAIVQIIIFSPVYPSIQQQQQKLSSVP